MSKERNRFLLATGGLLAIVGALVLYTPPQSEGLAGLKSVEIEIAKDGTILMDGQKLAPEEFDKAYKAAMNPSEVPDIILEIAPDNSLRWNGQKVDSAALDRHLMDAAKQSPKPILRVVAAPNTERSMVMRVFAAASRHGLLKVGFVGISAPN
jgi:biopolymer transport protein ExbD